MCDLTTKRTPSASMRASASCFISASVCGVASWTASPWTATVAAELADGAAGAGGAVFESVGTVLCGSPPVLAAGDAGEAGASTTLPDFETVMGTTRCGPRLWRPDLGAAGGRGAITGAPGVAI